MKLTSKPYILMEVKQQDIKLQPLQLHPGDKLYFDYDLRHSQFHDFVGKVVVRNSRNNTLVTLTESDFRRLFYGFGKVVVIHEI